MQTNAVGILGSGTMGRQLALLFASKGYAVKLWNHQYHSNFEKEFERMAVFQSKLGLYERSSIPEIITQICYSIEIDSLKSCKILIEAIIEEMEAKKTLLKKICQINSHYDLLATNTSTLSITELASVTERPEQFLGLHFFNPAMTMKLVEVVRGELTDDDSINLALEILSILNKKPVILNETPGFIVNRLLFPMINEAIFLLSEKVADPKTIDESMRLGTNHPMGPLELADLIGLDVCLSILETLVEETGDAKYRPAPLLKKYVRAGKLGKKTGEGFYLHKIHKASQ